MSHLIKFIMIITALYTLSACIEDPVKPPSTLESETREVNADAVGLDQGIALDMISNEIIIDQSITQDMNLFNDDMQVLDMQAMMDMTNIDADAFSLTDAFTQADALILPPLESMPEVCDGIDNDLDYWVDEGVSNPCGGCNELAEQGCLSWQWKAIQDQDGIVPVGRMLGIASYVSEYQNFEISGASCSVYISPKQSFANLGTVWVDSPLASLHMQPNPERAGTYHTVPSTEGPVSLHRENEIVTLSWDGWQSTQALWQDIPAGMLAITSPPIITDVALSSLETLSQALGAEGDTHPASIPLYWEPSVEGEMHLYIGASRLRLRDGDYQVIEHYQVQAHLADDGVFDFPLLNELIDPQYSIWIYLERVNRGFVDLGLNHIKGRIGHRIETRRSGTSSENPELNARLVSPNPQQVQVNPTQGLQVSWDASALAIENSSVSLVRYDATRVAQLICVLEDPQIQSLLIPSEYLEFWPEGSDTFKQVTVNLNQKLETLILPDRGYIRSSLSLILPLND